MALTKEQQAAVNSRDENLLIAAAAGSGKTHVLVERIINLIEERACEVDKLLIMTFTNAAAQEMRERIQAALTKRLETELDSDNQIYLERQIILLSNAQISTFHSFCQSVLHRNFSRIDLDPKFRTGDTNEIEVLKHEVIEELFEDNYATGNDDFKNFTDEFGGSVKGDEPIHEMILKLHAFAMSMPYPDKWLDTIAEPYDLPEDAKLPDTKWFSSVWDFVSRTLDKIFVDAEQAIAIAEQINVAVKVILPEVNQINELKSVRDNWDKLAEKLSTITFGSMSGGRVAEAKKIARARLIALRNSYKSKILNLREKFLIAPADKMISDLRELYKPMCELIRITKEFEYKFAEAKRDRGIIDFNDMEHLALNIFDDAPEVAAAYRDKFKFIMVDEYQDTNGVQETIVKKIAREDNLFFVGDVKQSIYRFRLVDSENFKDKMYSDDYRCINLSKNFRSREKIINVVNEIFKRLMNRQATEIDYDEGAELRYGADYDTGEKYFDERPELCCIVRSKQNADNVNDDDDDNGGDIRIEMKFIAQKIHDIIESHKLIREGDGYREVKYRDIVILHRSPKSKAFEILDALKRYGIPAYVPDEEKYFQATEIQVIISLLNLLDNARQDIPLAAVMLSPIGGFSAEELSEIRLASPQTDFYTAVENGGDKCKDFLSKLNKWRDDARQLSVSELLSNLYRETGYYDSVGKENRGDGKQANLRILVDRAVDFQATNAHGLSRFLDFVKKIRAIGNDMSTAAISGENDNVVRVVTIHKSKGLEYPIVFVAGLGKRFNADDYTKGKIFLHKDLGVGAHRMPKGTALKVKTLATQALAKKIAEENLAEELRILYVALTRAKEKLFMVGVVSEKYLNEISQVDVPENYDILSAGKYMDWIMPIKDTLAPFMDYTEMSEVDIPIKAIELLETKKEQSPEPIKILDAAQIINVPAKVTVTELKRRAAEDEELPQLSDYVVKKSVDKYVYRRPDFIQAKEISGTEFGTLMHRVMERIDLSGDLSERGILAQVEELARRKIILQEHVRLIRVKVIAEFFASDIGKRLLNAQEIYRELPFNRFINAQKFFNVEEKIFIQGIIDLLFKDAAGRWVLLDYKTDRNTKNIAERYRVQINLYSQAVEAILGIKVAEKFLYLLHNGQTVKY
ncbi:MAG: helicase-exonuclease AddAB subunit AddA [Selenomonadaceae bacterium]|nr:helicase-exonuclease AddAB subunit AddA [Selenomonadaceae bacterium]